MNLADTLKRNETVDLNEKKYSEKDCYKQAVIINSSKFDTWYNLGISLRGNEVCEINNQKYSKKDCFQNTLNLNPE